MIRFSFVCLLCLAISACSMSSDYKNYNKELLEKFTPECVLEIPVKRSKNTFTTEYDGKRIDYIKISDDFSFVTDNFTGVNGDKLYIFYNNKTGAIIGIRKKFGIFSIKESASLLPNKANDSTGKYTCISKKDSTLKQIDFAIYVRESSGGDFLVGYFKYHDTTSIGYHNIDIRYTEPIPFNIKTESLLNDQDFANRILNEFEERALQQFSILPK